MAVIAIDGGGTKTAALAVREDGLLLASVTGGASNLNGGRESALDEVRSVVTQLAQQLQEQGEQVEALFAGMAGIEQGDNRSLVQDCLRRLLPACQRIEVDNDAVTALYSGTKGEAGIVQIAGTGSITYGLHPDGRRGRVGGWGYLLGDHGSGYAIGREAVIAALRQLDGLAPPTLLTELLTEAYSLTDIKDIVPLVYSEAPRRHVAAAVPVVMRAADAGDETALAIIQSASQAMGEAVVCLYQKLYGRGGSGEGEGAVRKVPVVLAGGVFARADLLLPPLKAVCERSGMPLELVIPAAPPVAGAVIAAMRLAGVPVSSRIYERISAQLAV